MSARACPSATRRRCAQHEWHVPERYNIAADVCDKHPRDKLAMIHEHFDGHGPRGPLGRAAGPRPTSFAHVLRAHGVERGDRVAMVLPPTPETAAAFFGDLEARRDPALDVGALRRRRHPPPARRLAAEGARHRRGQRGPRRPGAGRARADPRRRAAGRRRRRRSRPSTPPPTTRRSSTTRPARPGWPRASSTRTATCSRTRSSSTATRCRTASASTAWASGRGRRASRRCSGRGGSARCRSSTSARAASTRTSSSTSSPATARHQRLHDADGDALDDGDRRRRHALPAELPARLHGGRAAQPRGDPLVPRAVRRSPCSTTTGSRSPIRWSPTTRSWRSARARWASRCPAGTCRSSTRTSGRSPQGERGEICLRARSNPHYPLGYWRNEEAARRRSAATGSTPRTPRALDEDGYVWYEGRADDVIIAAGYRIGPFEVESACLEHPAVARGGRGRLARRAARQRRQGVHRAAPRATSRSDELADEIKALRARPAVGATPTRAGSSSSTTCPRRSPARSAGSSCASARPSESRALHRAAWKRAPPRRGPARCCPPRAARLRRLRRARARSARSQWQRMVDGLAGGAARCCGWRSASAAGRAVLACDRLPPRWRGLAMLGVALAALLAAVVGRGARRSACCARAGWDELGEGLAARRRVARHRPAALRRHGPLARADAPAARRAAAASLAALLACWPRAARRAATRSSRWPPCSCWSPRRSSRSAARGRSLLGAALAALTVCFLWLERLPLRPGLGVAALLGVALAGALPLAAVADRGEPWFDYQAFAEGLGPDDPVRFDWARLRADRLAARRRRGAAHQGAAPAYWKVARPRRVRRRRAGRRARSTARGRRRRGRAARRLAQRAELARDRIEVSVRRLRTARRDRRRHDARRRRTRRGRWSSGVEPGRWRRDTELRRGDSYTAAGLRPASDAPPSSPGATDRAPRPARRRPRLTVPFLPRPRPTPRARRRRAARCARSTSAPFGRRAPRGRTPTTARRRSRRGGDGAAALALRAHLAARAAAAGAAPTTPYEYVARGRRATCSDGFTYTERPAARRAPGVAPLDALPVRHQEGYCQHFSGAMALLLRMGGVPARVATGFTPGRLLQAQQAWIVRDTDAHAWVEAWFDGYGWVTFDPTPGRHPGALPDRRARAPAAPRPTTPSRRRRRRRRAAAAPAGGRAATCCGPASAATSSRRRRGDDAGGGGRRWWLVRARRRCSRRAGAGARSALPPAPRAARPADAARPRGRRARGGAAPRRAARAAPAPRCASSSSASAAREDARPTCAR